ncbi:hypothetical protein [Actinomadura sp. GTD37]|uniref:hypothetical protein n=1 Tax=Actinomadura sp. GTD37 TaxID=1778030 RepID=UPI0035C25DDE
MSLSPRLVIDTFPENLTWDAGEVLDGVDVGALMALGAWAFGDDVAFASGVVLTSSLLAGLLLNLAAAQGPIMATITAARAVIAAAKIALREVILAEMIWGSTDWRAGSPSGCPLWPDWSLMRVKDTGCLRALVFNRLCR